MDTYLWTCSVYVSVICIHLPLTIRFLDHDDVRQPCRRVVCFLNEPIAARLFSSFNFRFFWVIGLVSLHIDSQLPLDAFSLPSQLIRLVQTPWSVFAHLLVVAFLGDLSLLVGPCAGRCTNHLRCPTCMSSSILSNFDRNDSGYLCQHYVG